jgi:hypothetical protein
MAAARNAVALPAQSASHSHSRTCWYAGEMIASAEIAARLEHSPNLLQRCHQPTSRNVESPNGSNSALNHWNKQRCGFQAEFSPEKFPDSSGSSMMREPIASVSAARARSGCPLRPFQAIDNRHMALGDPRHDFGNASRFVRLALTDSENATPYQAPLSLRRFFFQFCWRYSATEMIRCARVSQRMHFNAS